MIYFILTIFFLIFTGGVYLLYRKMKKMKKKYEKKIHDMEWIDY